MSGYSKGPSLFRYGLVLMAVQEAKVATPHGKPQGLTGLTPALDGHDVDGAIVDAVRKWVFEPAKCDGVPMVENTLITFQAEVR
jgi:hypothetical protein